MVSAIFEADAGSQINFAVLHRILQKNRVFRERLPSAFMSSFLIGLAVVCMGGCAREHTQSADIYRKEYRKPLSSSGAQFASLPLVVQNSIRAETGSAELAHVIKDTHSGRVVYEIDFQEPELYRPLCIASDGSLLDPNLLVAIGAPADHSNVISGGAGSGLTLNDLPAQVVKLLQRHAPDAQLNSIMKQVQGDQTTYLITFKDQLHPALLVASDGTILSEAK
jgi:hypothetical protein